NLEAVIWTTTPWTLPANRCVAVHPKLSYTLFRKAGDANPDTVYLAATDRMGEMEKRFSSTDGTGAATPATLEPLGEISGEELAGTLYKHPLSGESLPFITADYVTADSGSGL